MQGLTVHDIYMIVSTILVHILRVCRQWNNETLEGIQPIERCRTMYLFKANVTAYVEIASKVNMADVSSIGNYLNMSSAP